MICMDWFVVDSRYKPAFERLRLDSFSSAVAFFSGKGDPARRSLVEQKQVQLPDGSSLPVFYKQYEFANASWRYLWRASKARCEFQNYAAFEQLGIPCAERIACGEQRDWIGRLHRAFIVTKALPNSGSLVEFVQQQCPTRATVEFRKLRSLLLNQLADLTRRMHAAKFFHHDQFGGMCSSSLLRPVSRSCGLSIVHAGSSIAGRRFKIGDASRIWLRSTSQP